MFTFLKKICSKIYRKKPEISQKNLNDKIDSLTADIFEINEELEKIKKFLFENKK